MLEWCLAGVTKITITGTFIIFFAFLQICTQLCLMDNVDWNEQAKRLLKSELVKRGVSNEDLAFLLKDFGGNETKASIGSKISRGTFSAAFLLKCLNALDCQDFNPIVKVYDNVEEARVKYHQSKSDRLKRS